MVCRQGPHQVAQKSSRTTLPRKLVKETAWPRPSGSVKSAAGAPAGAGPVILEIFFVSEVEVSLVDLAGPGFVAGGKEIIVGRLYFGTTASLWGPGFEILITALIGILLMDPGAKYLTSSPSTQARLVIMTLPSFI